MMNKNNRTDKINGILNILKPTGMTSHDVVSSVRKILNTRKVGHAGTLDPNVAGVLVLCVGKGTKFSEILMNGDKEYICELVLGKQTDTQDSYGSIINEKVVPKFDIQEIKEALNYFKGKQTQIPPAYSAVKHNGKKLYEYARNNIIIEKSGRDIDIKELILLKFEQDKILMKVKCTKGTYMRTLCNDIGNYLNTFGHMGVLIRTEAKGLHINDSITLEELEFLQNNNRLNECLILVDEMFLYEHVFVKEEYYHKLIQGNEVYVDTSTLKDKELFVYCNDILIGLGHITNVNRIKIDKMLL